MATDRGQRRSQLVGDSHQEVSLERVRCLELRRHLAEPLREVADLIAARHLRNGDAVVASRDLVGRVGEREHGSRDSPRQIPAECAGDQDPSKERRQQPPHERQPALAQTRARSRQDDRAEDLVGEFDRHREPEQSLLAARPSEFELDGVPREDPAEIENRPRQKRVRGRRTREDVDALRATDVEDLVAGRALELVRGRWVATCVRGVDLGDSARLPTELTERLLPERGLGIALRDADRDRGRDEAREHDRGEEERREPEAQRAEHVRLFARRSPNPARGRPCSRPPRPSRPARRRQACGATAERGHRPCGCLRQRCSPRRARAAGRA